MGGAAQGHGPAGPGTHGGLPTHQALTAEIVKTIRDIIALNPLYRLVYCPLPNPSVWLTLPEARLGALCGNGLAGTFLKSVLVEDLWSQGFKAQSLVLCGWSLFPPSWEALGGRGTTAWPRFFASFQPARAWIWPEAFIVVNWGEGGGNLLRGPHVTALGALHLGTGALVSWL